MSAPHSGLLRSLAIGRRYIYLHIPKTAGMAIKSAIGRSSYAGQFLCKPHSCSFKSLSTIERRRHVFTSIRDPLTWYASLYNFKIHSSSDNPAKNYSEMSENSLDDFFSDVLHGHNGIDGFIKWNKPIEYKQHILEMLKKYYSSGANGKIGFYTLNFIYYCCLSWKSILTERDINKFLIRNSKELINVRTVLRMENLQEDFNEMVKGQGIHLDLSGRINKMSSNPYLSEVRQSKYKEIFELDNVIYKLFYS